jgi:hypothetical protein
MFAFLKLIPIRFWIYAAIAAAFAFVLMREKWAVDKAKRLSAENTQLTQSLKAAEQSRAIEQADRRHADETARNLEAELVRIRNQPPITGVRCRTSVPRAATQGGTTASTQSPATESHEGMPEPDSFGPEADVSAGVDWFGEKCEEAVATIRAWQEWDESRTH